MEEYTVKVHNNGDKLWYQNGKLHRLDGPAVEWSDGDKFWYQNGKRHRLDGPAIEWATGSKAWYIEGKELTEEEFNEAVYSKKRTRRRRNIDYGDLTEEQYEQRKLKYTQDIIDGVCGIGINFITWMDSCGYKHEGRHKFIRKEQRYNKVEVTLEDIAKAMDIDVKKLRIKGMHI